MRDKHHIDWDALYGSMTMCVECYDLYPCDVIKLLDATEPLLKVEQEPLIQQNLIKGCDHEQGTYDDYGKDENGKFTVIHKLFTYCPKCGVKL